MAETAVVYPLGIAVMRGYLLSRTEVTTIVSTRIGTSMPAPPVFPAVRLTELMSTVQISRVWMRMFFQADCWATSQPDADRLARVLIDVLERSANYVATGAVMGTTQDLAARTEADTSITPAQPRSMVTGHTWFRPN